MIHSSNQALRFPQWNSTPRLAGYQSNESRSRYHRTAGFMASRERCSTSIVRPWWTLV